MDAQIKKTNSFFMTKDFKLRVVFTKSILLVEEEPELEAVFSRVVHSIDPSINLERVSSGGEAKQLILEREFDLIVVDIGMDGKKNGNDLLDYCQAEYPELPILLTSGMGIDKYLKWIETSRIGTLFLPKPFYLEECREIIEHMLFNYSGYVKRRHL